MGVVEELKKCTREVLSELTASAEELWTAGDNYGVNDIVYRATQVWGHDTRGIMSGLGGFVALRELRESALHEPKRAERVSKSIYNLKLFTTLMAYLASEGDERFVLPVNFSDLELLLTNKNSSANKRKMMSFGDIPTEGVIKSPDYVAFCEIVGNARDNFVISASNNGEMTSFTVRDYGTGLVNKKGKPLTRRKIPNIFGDYSTRRYGGLGLQVVNDVMNLRGGYVEVTSTVEGRSTLFYRTDEKKAKFIKPKQEVGTAFTINVPVS